ncbi:hypothetical protein [Kosakonia arachidis]|nr:hypothetical protein [Kosakonia arachidis]
MAGCDLGEALIERARVNYPESQRSPPG